ncbi:hypothetical protein AM500_18550 [Bacillus sp. FJAT-18017]|uniref:hypothetical protein n=1 Tax=Bacillus sp. FJAT-18017 TaxID=1705566 RepID=UPI0006AEE46C|nr:hypothetical protein [Bacillus sp. FJAT-18017]ALC91562.1 hypothetical protein AM500_18550 [Bacillus sp. FJAT-18017]
MTILAMKNMLITLFTGVFYFFVTILLIQIISEFSSLRFYLLTDNGLSITGGFGIAIGSFLIALILERKLTKPLKYSLYSILILIGVFILLLIMALITMTGSGWFTGWFQ